MQQSAHRVLTHLPCSLSERMRFAEMSANQRRGNKNEFLAFDWSEEMEVSSKCDEMRASAQILLADVGVAEFYQMKLENTLLCEGTNFSERDLKSS